MLLSTKEGKWDCDTGRTGHFSLTEPPLTATDGPQGSEGCCDWTIMSDYRSWEANSHARLTLQSEIYCHHWFDYCASSQVHNSWGPPSILSPNSITEKRLISSLPQTTTLPPLPLQRAQPFEDEKDGGNSVVSAQTRQPAVLALFKTATGSFHSLSESRRGFSLPQMCFMWGN